MDLLDKSGGVGDMSNKESIFQSLKGICPFVSEPGTMAYPTAKHSTKYKRVMLTLLLENLDDSFGSSQHRIIPCPNIPMRPYNNGLRDSLGYILSTVKEIEEEYHDYDPIASRIHVIQDKVHELYYIPHPDSINGEAICNFRDDEED